jgi:hypothetical protein
VKLNLTSECRSGCEQKKWYECEDFLHMVPFLKNMLGNWLIA